MKRTTSLWIFAVAIFGSLGFTQNANAAVALCVGCTTTSQFQSAAWQAFGSGYTQGITYLVSNPDTGLSQYVTLQRIAPGGHVNAVSANTDSVVGKKVSIGSATPMTSDFPSSIYFAEEDGKQDRVISQTGLPIQNANSAPVSAAEQVDINTAVQISKQTFFVQLDPVTFPSYAGSMDISIAMQNWTALSQAPGIKWPVTALGSSVWTALQKLMGVYTGHSFTVCDAFGNGDSACFVPDPVMNNVLTQTGPAKNAQGVPLANLANRVPGDTGAGMGVAIQPPAIIQYTDPPSQSYIRCGYVNGQLSTCVQMN